MELFNGGGKVFDRKTYPLEKRLEIADCLADIPRRFKLPLAFGTVQRAKQPPHIAKLSAHERTVAAHGVAFMVCTMQCDIWLRMETDGENALLVSEDTPHSTKVITEAQVTHQSPAALKRLHGGEVPEPEASYFPLLRIKQRPLFEPKAPSSILQLADFCAYVYKRRLMDDRRYDRFFGPCRSRSFCRRWSGMR